MVLTEARDLFLNDRETYCSDKTVKNYRNNLRSVSYTHLTLPTIA